MSRSTEPDLEKTPEDPRVRFAAERTLLAWVRTGLAMMGFGFVVARFGMFLREIGAMGRTGPVVHSGLSLWIGTALVVMGVAVHLLSVAQYVHVLRRIDQRLPYEPPRLPLGVAVAVGLALVGMTIVVYLVRLAR